MNLHPVELSRRSRMILDCAPAPRAPVYEFLWSQCGFVASPYAAALIERHTLEYRLFWDGPFNDRDWIKW